jgi:uncharacterized protein
MRLLLCTLMLSVSGLGQGLDYLRANYTKYEHLIPMRDGKKLFTSVYVPKDDSRTYGVVLSRTPYSAGPYGVDRYRDNIAPSVDMAKQGYIVVYQDVRGRWMSEGEHVNMRPHKATKAGTADIDESTDTWDTIDWLVKNVPGNNGRVCTWGISYPGFYTAAGMIDAHAAHKCASPQAPIVDWFTGDDFHRNGALYLPHAFNFLAVFGKPRPEPTSKANEPFVHGTPDGYRFFLEKMGPLYNANEKFLKNEVAFWNDMMKHETYDEFWQSRNLRPHIKGIKPAVMTVGGWFDTENLYGALQVFRSVQRQSPETPNFLVMGPWYHGQWARGDGDRMGNAFFGAKTSEYYRQQIESSFFAWHLNDKKPGSMPKAWVFETGRNQWRQFASWPPAGVESSTIQLGEKGRLQLWAAPGPAERFSEFLSDPNKPVPYIENISNRLTREHMTDDQRFATTRPDVLTWVSDELKEDFTLAGPIEADLRVSTTGTDGDFIVKVIDVFPDDAGQIGGKDMSGYAMLLRGEVFRGKFRRSFTTPEPFVPGKVDQVKYKLNDVFHTFRKGHRFMVQIQCSWFPAVDRNPQKFMSIPQAREEDFQKATIHVHHNSTLVLPWLKVMPQK